MNKVERRVHERAAELAVINEKLRREVAERQRAEEALQESESRLSHSDSDNHSHPLRPLLDVIP